MTAIEEIRSTDRGFPVGWSWRCCTRGCDVSQYGLASHEDAFVSTERMRHVCSDDVLAANEEFFARVSARAGKVSDGC